MLNKKNAPSQPISDRDILAMAEDVLPLLYHNPENSSIISEVNIRLREIVPYDFFHYLMDADPSDGDHAPLNITFERWNKELPSIVLRKSTTLDEDWDEAVENNYRTSIADSKKRRPNANEYHYYRIESKEHPRIVIGFFRYKDSQNDNAFSFRETKILEQLAPHLILLFRIALSQESHSQAFQYFGGFAKLGSKMVNEHGLSEMEVRLIPDILFGYTNEQIAERQFISIPTVKSHIKHILKKTGTKNRVDFIAKYFTSPDHVRL